MGLLKCWDKGTVVVLTLSVFRGRGRDQAAHGGDPPLKRSLGGRGLLLLGRFGRGESYSWVPRGTPAACCCPQAGCRCRPGMPQRAWGRRQLVQPFQQMVSPLLWELLPAPSWVAPGGWGRALRGRKEVLWYLTLGIAVLERDLDPGTPVLVTTHRALEGRRCVGVPFLLRIPLSLIPGVPSPCRGRAGGFL